MKQTFIWHAPSSSVAIPLDAFYLTEIWHQFEDFQASEDRAYILRRKRIHHSQSLVEGKAYSAELKCINQRTLRHFNQSCYLFTVTQLNHNDIQIEIETTFITMKETFPKQRQKSIKSPSMTEAVTSSIHVLQLEITWEDVENYLKTVSDYNPIHWEEEIMPGDFVVMKALEVGSMHYPKLKNYCHLDIKYKQMIMKDEGLYMQIKPQESHILITVYNTAYQPCIEIKVSRQ